MKKILVVLLLLMFIGTNRLYADITVKGNKTVYTSELRLLTEGPTAPISPREGDLYRDTENNDLYVYTDGAWKIKRMSAELKTAIQDFKSSVALVSEANTKKALVALGKLIKAIYKEE